MARYRKLDLRTWSDQKFRELTQLKPSGQALWLYLILGPCTTNIPGLFEASEVDMADRLNWSLEDFRKAFREASAKGMAKADWRARLVWLPQAPEYNRPESPNVVISWASTFDELPECPLKWEAFQSLKVFAEGLPDAFREAFRRAFAKAMPNQEQEQEQEQKQEQEQEVSLSSAEAGSTACLLPDPVEHVFEHWRQAHGHTKAKLDPKRRKLIRSALKGYGLEEICRSISGYLSSPHHMGENPSKTRYDSIELLLRDNKHIEAGLRFHSEPPQSRLDPRTQSNVAAAQEALRRAGGSDAPG